MNDTPQQTTAMTVAEDNPPALALVKAPLTAGAAPRAIVPVDFDGAYRIANVIVRAGMAPRTLNTVEKAMVAILHGLEVGLTPMNALQSIAVINGRPTIWGDGAIGLIRASGLLEYMDEHFEGEGTKLVAVCVVKRKGEPKPVRGEFSWSDVLRAHLNNKEGPWQTYPRRMMQMRARWPLRDVFADVLKGLALKEEIEDMETSAAPQRTEAPARRAVPAPPPVDGTAQQAEKPAEQAKAVERPADEKPSDGFPGDKVSPTKPAPDPLDIPPELDRRVKKPTLPPADDISDKDRDWLLALDQDFADCATIEDLTEQQNSLMAPHKGTVSGTVWNKAMDVLNKHIERIEGAAGG